MIDVQTFRPLFSEISPLFMSGRDTPNVIRMRIRMDAEVEEAALRDAVDLTMRRYPYFCVKLRKRDGQWGFVPNSRPVAVLSGPANVMLNSAAANEHLLAFSWHEDWILLDISHALTDGTGAMEVVRTLLYYYCSRRYGAVLRAGNIRLAGDEISPEEWEDPAPRVTQEPPEDGDGQQPVLNLVRMAGLEKDTAKTVYSFTVDEKQLMRFNRKHDATPGTIVALLLSRAIVSLYPDSQDRTLINLCLNLRKALGTPLAHQCLVGDVWLEYKEEMRRHPVSVQATMYRGMVLLQMQPEQALTVMTYINRYTRQMLAMRSDEERVRSAKNTSEYLKEWRTATVSYVGRGNLGDSERYIRDFHLWASAENENLLVEITSVNGRFTIDFIQNFASPVYIHAFMHQLDEIGIPFERQAPVPLELPGIRLPWME